MKKTNVGRRIVAVTVCLLFVLLCLASCNSGKNKQIDVSSQVEFVNVGKEICNGIEDIEVLRKAANIIANNNEALYAFLAAYRGYDITGEDYDPENKEIDYSENKGVSPEYGVKVIEKYRGDSLIGVDFSAFNEYDMQSMMKAFETEVDVETGRRGLLGSIEYGIGVALGWITNTICFGNYLFGMCVFAILIEIVMLPLSINQQKNSIRQAKLRPMEQAIRAKYAGRNDQVTQQKIQKEIQELYAREKYSPASGCLPLLLQFPIIIILYNIIIDPLQYMLGMPKGISNALASFYTLPRAAGGLGESLASSNGTIEILSKFDAETFAGMKDFPLLANGGACYDKLLSVSGSIPRIALGKLNLGLTPSTGGWLIVIPILTFFAYFFSMKLTRKMSYQATTATDPQMGCSNNIMDISMPLMSVFFTFFVPAAVGIYWIWRSLVGLLKQFILSRVMPYPKFTEEEYKAAEKAYRAQEKNNFRRTPDHKPSDKPVRSLHHIDDDE